MLDAGERTRLRRDLERTFGQTVEVRRAGRMVGIWPCRLEPAAIRRFPQGGDVEQRNAWRALLPLGADVREEDLLTWGVVSFAVEDVDWGLPDETHLVALCRRT